MADETPLELYAREVRRDAAAARRRSLTRRAAAPLAWKFIRVVPSVFSARGELAAFRLRTSAAEAMERLGGRLVLTLDSAAEILGGFRFGRNRNIYAYVSSRDDLVAVEEQGIGERRPGTRFPLTWAPPGWDLLFAVVCAELPPHGAVGGHRCVTPAHLVRDLLGLYGARADLLAEIEQKLAGFLANPT